MPWNELRFDILKGKIISKIDNYRDELVFITNDGDFRQIYIPDCCAQCSIEEIHGDLHDLIGHPVLMAEEVTNKEYSDHESKTWTFYKLATIKGSVTIRWFGSSNGYYSEAPSFETYDRSCEKND